MPTPKELGVNMAKTLLAELTVIDNAQHLEESRLQIVDPVPSDGKFFEYQKDKVKIEPTKEALLQDMLQNRKSIVAFCCVSLKTDTRMTFDIDHVFPRERITEKQKLLLSHLNNPSNNALAQAFMGEKPDNSALQKQINQYFQRDPDDNNKIKGTKWFFDVCYNNLSNLFHLKHYLNRGKSAKTPKEWFENNFPLKFIQDLKEKGGINEGVIMQQIFHKVVNGVTLDSINLGKVKDKNSKEVGDDVVVYLHENKGIGLGEFIREWFKTNAETIIKESKEIQQINAALTLMLESKLKDSQGEEGLRKFISTINQVLKIAEKRNILKDDSSEDSQDTGLAREIISLQAISWAFNYMHSIKQMKKQFLELVDPSSKDIIKKYIYSSYINQLFSIGDDGIEIALSYLKQQCDTLKQGSNTILLTESEAKTLLNNAKKEGDPKERVKAAEAKAAEEIKAREEEKLAYEKEIAELKALLPPEKRAKLGAGPKPF